MMNNLIEQKTSVNSVAISNSTSGFKMTPTNLGEVVRFADVMARAGVALPKHLRENAGACMAVAMQAFEWGMSPFAVASKSYSVNDRIAYEAQLIAAVVNTRSGIKGRLKYDFIGEGNDLSCKVTGVLDDVECVYQSPKLSQITTKNSPLWKTDPQQQLGYFAARSWARRFCPEVLLGVYDRDEVSQIVDVEVNNKPTIVAKLEEQQKRDSQFETVEGFDIDHVEAEVENITDEFELGDENSSASPDGGSISPPLDTAPETITEEAALDAFDNDGYLQYVAKAIVGSIGEDEKIVINQSKAVFDERMSQDARDKAKSIVNYARQICRSEIEAEEGLKLIAGIAKVDYRELS